MSPALLLVAFTSVAAAPNAPTAPAENPKLIVLELQPGGGIDPSVAGPLSESITAEIGARGFYQVVSSREVQTLLGMERQKELLGCSEDSANCMAELSGALGARFVLSGTVARLGEAYQLSLQTMDTQKAQTLGRTTRLAKDLESLHALIPLAVAEATGTPPPPAPSRLLQYSLIGAGALSMIGGGIVGQDALSRQAVVQSELDRGRALDTFASYEEQRDGLNRQKLISLAALGAGVALIATGVFTLPPESGGPIRSAALVPSGNGVWVVGTWR